MMDIVKNTKGTEFYSLLEWDYLFELSLVWPMGWLRVFVNEVLIEHSDCSFVYILSLAASVELSDTDHTAHKPKLYTMWPFKKSWPPPASALLTPKVSCFWSSSQMPEVFSEASPLGMFGTARTPQP